MAKPQIYRHNGGMWTRADIPSATAITYKCAVCHNDFGSQEEIYHEFVLTQIVDRVRYIPASRYWHGTLPLEFCSIECSFKYYEQEMTPKVDAPSA